MQTAAYTNSGIVAVRYPRGGELYRPRDFKWGKKTFDFYGSPNAQTLLITYGRLFSYACLAKERLFKKGIDICILKLGRIKPIPKEAIAQAKRFSYIFFFEEGMAAGGVGEHFMFELSRGRWNGNYSLTAIDNRFVQQSSVESSLRALSLDDSGMANIISKGIREDLK